jgi:hypothetical protein
MNHSEHQPLLSVALTCALNDVRLTIEYIKETKVHISVLRFSLQSEPLKIITWNTHLLSSVLGNVSGKIRVFQGHVTCELNSLHLSFLMRARGSVVG